MFSIRKYKYKVTVYAISKNEEKFVDRWVKSMSEADNIVVLDTGSSDKTVEKLIEHNVSVYEEAIEPFRFDVARNVSLSYVPKDTDIYVCTDFDDVLEEGWREKLELAWEEGMNRLFYTYYYDIDDEGKPLSELVYFKIHSKDYEWTGQIHEFIRYTGSGAEKTKNALEIVCYHYQDKSKTRSVYLKIMERLVSENPNHVKMWYYLSLEYFSLHKYDKCIEAAKRYLSIATSIWTLDRARIKVLVAESYFNIGDFEKSYMWFCRAIVEQPEQREPYLHFLDVASSLDDWVMVYFVATEALLIKEKKFDWFHEIRAWDGTFEFMLSRAYEWLELYDEAIFHSDLALKLSPDDKKIVDHVVRLQKEIANRNSGEFG